MASYRKGSFGTCVRAVDGVPRGAITGYSVVLLYLPKCTVRDALGRVDPCVNRTVIKDVMSDANFFFFTRRVLRGKAGLFKFRHAPFVTHAAACNGDTELLKCGPRVTVTIRGVGSGRDLRGTVRLLYGAPYQVLGGCCRTDLAGDGPVLRAKHLCSV